VSSRHPILGQFARWAIGLALLAVLLRTIGLDDVRQEFARVQDAPGWLAAALALTFLALFAGVVRWHLLLRAMGLPTPFHRSFRGFFIGQFFNAFLFGACGGDLARAVHAAHAHPARRAEAVTSVFLDRVLGLLVTLVIGCGLLLLRFRYLANDPHASRAGWLMMAFLAAATGGLLLLFSHNIFARLSWLARWQHRGWIGPLVRRMYDALFFFRQHGRHLFWPTVLSVVNLLLLAAASGALARAMNLALPFMDLLTVFPIITVLAAIPITPGALGVRETLFIQLLQPFGVAAGAAVSLSLLGYFAGSAWSLFGGLLFLLAPRPTNPPP